MGKLPMDKRSHLWAGHLQGWLLAARLPTGATTHSQGPCRGGRPGSLTAKGTHGGCACKHNTRVRQHRTQTLAAYGLGGCSHTRQRPPVGAIAPARSTVDA
ncbi:hypothetical protein GW17_00020298 [Ensete ventricosum]|nr:hypothetical protein GW17_00020298 [Ensete ventricosum]